MAKGTKYSQQFQEDAVQYRLEHPELPLRKVAENLGISESALKNWMKAAKEHKSKRFTKVLIKIMVLLKLQQNYENPGMLFLKKQSEIICGKWE